MTIPDDRDAGIPLAYVHFVQADIDSHIYIYVCTYVFLSFFIYIYIYSAVYSSIYDDIPGDRNASMPLAYVHFVQVNIYIYIYVYAYIYMYRYGYVYVYLFMSFFYKCTTISRTTPTRGCRSRTSTSYR